MGIIARKTPMNPLFGRLGHEVSGDMLLSRKDCDKRFYEAIYGVGFAGKVNRAVRGFLGLRDSKAIVVGSLEDEANKSHEEAIRVRIPKNARVLRIGEEKLYLDGVENLGKEVRKYGFGNVSGVVLEDGRVYRKNGLNSFLIEYLEILKDPQKFDESYFCLK